MTSHTLILFFCLFGKITALRRNKNNSPHFLKSTSSKSETSASPMTYQQITNHFDRGDSSTFNQRYWVDDSSFDSSCSEKPTGCAVFVMLGGEGEANPPGGHMLDLAQEFGALGVSVEHRFFGESIIPNNEPGGNFTNDHLRLLTVNQALADFAMFLGTFIDSNPEISLPEKRTKYYTFGGSYSGELASWMRIKYPHLVAGAVASSAPVKAETDYYGYDPIVIKALRDDRVGGSEECGDSVVNAFQDLAARLSNDVESVLSDFHICQGDDLSTDMDRRELLDFVSDDFMAVVQYNNVNDETKNIGLSCGAMLNKTVGKTPYERLVSMTVKRLAPGECLGANYTDAVRVQCDGTYAERAWLWQMCADGSGHDQTCRKVEGCPFIEEYATFGQFREFCKDCFGVSGEEMDLASLTTSINFGDNSTLGGSNIIYVNGDNDPFSWGGVNSNSSEALSREVYAFVVDAGSHCQDMNHVGDNDSESMRMVKEGKKEVLKGWINGVVLD